MRKRWIAMAAFLAVAGCGTANAAPHKAQPNVKQIFLDYIPPGEPIAPRNMEWLVDHLTNNPGYYHSGHLPGTFSIHYDGPSAYTNFETMTGKSLFSEREYMVRWNIGGDHFRFLVFQVYKLNKKGTGVPTSQWEVGPQSKASDLLQTYVYTQS